MKSNRNTKSLKLKILIPTVGIIVLCFGLITVIMMVMMRNIITSDAREVSSLKVRSLITFIDGKLAYDRTQIELFASNEIVRSMDIPRAVQYLKNHKKLSKDFEFLFVGDTTGYYLTTQGKKGNIADRPYFKKVMNGETVISDPVISRSTGKVITVISAPVLDGGGTVKGIIAGTITMQKLSGVLNQEKFGRTGYACLLGSDGIVVAHPNKDFILKKNLLKDKSDTLRAIVKKMIGGETGFGTYTFEGVEKSASFGPLKSVRWSILVTAPTSEIHSDMRIVLYLALIMGFITVLLVFLIIRLVDHFVRPISQMATVAREIGEGNLQAREFEEKDDEIGLLGRNFNLMVTGMRSLISAINEAGARINDLADDYRRGADESHSVSKQISMTVNELAGDAAEQNDRVQTGFSMIETHIRGLGKIAEFAAASEKMAMNTMETVSSGVRAVDHQLEKMREFRSAAIKVGEQVTDLGGKSTRIEEITKAIADIAERTNLLALNASIEAARAGEHGKGFAVVADEVGTLAEQAGKASKEISLLVKEIQTGITNTVEDMKQVETLVDEEERAVDATSHAFKSISSAATEVEHQTKLVSEALVELGSNTESVKDIIQNISDIIVSDTSSTEQLAASMEEHTATVESMASSSNVLGEMAGSLLASINRFKL